MNFRLFFSFVILPLWSLASPGQIHPTFNDLTRGYQQVVAASTTAAVLQSDGKIVLGLSYGAARLNLKSMSGLARLLPDGSLDPDFAITPLFVTRVYCLLARPNGDIPVGGECANANSVRRVGLSRFHADGTHDATYAIPLGSSVYGGGGTVGVLVRATGRKDPRWRQFQLLQRHPVQRSHALERGWLSRPALSAAGRL
jgi:hypothetical protein